MLFEIWSGGDGHETSDMLHGRAEAETFEDACRLLSERDPEFADDVKIVGGRLAVTDWSSSLLPTRPSPTYAPGAHMIARRERTIERVAETAGLERALAERVVDEVLRSVLRQEVERVLYDVRNRIRHWILDEESETDPRPLTLAEFKLYPLSAAVATKFEAYAGGRAKRL